MHGDHRLSCCYIAVLAVSEFRRTQIRSKAMTESENLRIIESAKSQFPEANPGKQIFRLTREVSLLGVVPNSGHFPRLLGDQSGATGCPTLMP